VKNYIKKLIVLIFLGASSTILSMEEQCQQQEPMLLGDLGLPNEIWSQILEHAYFDPSILDKANDIYEAIDTIERHIAKYIQTLPFVCKTFRALQPSQEQWNKFKEKIRKLYIPFLNERFLEKREGKEGFYPKNGQWDTYNKLNNDIAKFTSTGIRSYMLLFELVAAHATNLIHLLLFYGANPNIKDNNEQTALHWAIWYYDPIGNNNASIICLLLQHGINPNIKNEDEETALYQAVYDYDPTECNNTEIIRLLLEHNANPYIKTKEKENAFDIARKNNFTDFPQLVRDHSQNTLKKICLQYILTNLQKFEDQLDTLPIELRDKINSLKS